MLVTIVINNFNYGQFLREAINSALTQTHKACEVIVVDDGSTDNSREVISSFGDRIRVVLKENGGQSSALNAGFFASQGMIVIFLDADDMLEPAAVEMIVKSWVPGTALMQAPLRLISANGSSHETGHQIPQAIYGGDAVALMLEVGEYTYPPTTGNAFSRECLNKILPIPNEPFRLNADAYLALKAPFYGDRVVLPRTVGMYRVHSRNGFYVDRKDLSEERIRTIIHLNEIMLDVVRSEASKRGLKLGRYFGNSLKHVLNRTCCRRLHGQPYQHFDHHIFLDALLVIRALLFQREPPFRKRLTRATACLVMLLLPRILLKRMKGHLLKAAKISLQRAKV